MAGDRGIIMSDITKEKDGSLKVTIPHTPALAIIQLSEINDISLIEAFFEIYSAGVTKKFPKNEFLNK